MRRFDVRQLRSHATRKRRGFTLIEAALATVIIGTGVLAMIFAQQTFHQQNDWAQQSAVAMRLAGEIRELAINLPRHDPVTGVEWWGIEPNETTTDDWDDVDDLDGAIFSADIGNGPISAMRTILLDMPGWTQRIEVESVDPFDLSTVVPDGTSEMLRVRVIVLHQGAMDLAPEEVTRLEWVQPR
jgi:type II secretory pathway pseudopilin PulG